MNLVLLAAAFPLLALPLRAEPASAQPVRVTTDSAEYCGILSERLALAPLAEAEPARSLAAEGRRLCQDGHVRTGVAKLRRALRAANPTH